MLITVDQLEKGEKAVIRNCLGKDIPLKLIEMGCIEGSYVELVHHAPLSDPLYLNVNGTFLAIRKETASLILVEKI